MKHNLMVATLFLGLLCTLFVHAMEKEDEIIVPVEVTVAASNSGEPDKIISTHSIKHVTLQEKTSLGMTKEETDKLQASLNNLMEQPKEQQDEIETILKRHKHEIESLKTKNDKLTEHVVKLHDAMTHLKKPVHYQLHLPSAMGTSIITFYNSIYAGKLILNILKHDAVKKNICKLLLTGGIIAWSGAQAYHYWRAFYTPTLSEKEEEKIKQLEKKIESNTILNDVTKK